MKEIFIAGGIDFMVILTVLLVITTCWMIYHFIVAYTSKSIDKTEHMRKISYGKSLGLFALMTGLFGQMLGFASMFSQLDALVGTEVIVTPEMVYGGIKVTWIVTIYGSFIYLLSLLIWFVASVLINKKQEK